MTRKMGMVKSQVRVAGVRPRERFGSARFGRRERRGPEVGLGGGIKDSDEGCLVELGGCACDVVDALRVRRVCVRRRDGEDILAGWGRIVCRRDTGRALSDLKSFMLSCEPRVAKDI